MLLSDGTSKAIEDMEVGDLVLASDLGTGEAGAEKKITDLILGEGFKELVGVGSDPDGDGVVDWVTATATHRFWVPARGWIDANNLVLGDRLSSDRGELIEVTHLAKSTKVARVHNLTVDRVHTYYVSVGGKFVLVHNESCPVHGHAPSGKGKSSKGKHDQGNSRRIRDQARSNNPNKRPSVCAKLPHCPR